MTATNGAYDALAKRLKYIENAIDIHYENLLRISEVESPYNPELDQDLGSWQTAILTWRSLLTEHEEILAGIELVKGGVV